MMNIIHVGAFLSLLLAGVAEARYEARCGVAGKTFFQIMSIDHKFEGKNNNKTWAISFNGRDLMAEGTVSAIAGEDNMIHFVQYHSSEPIVATEYVFGPYDINNPLAQPTVSIYEIGGYIGFYHRGTYACSEELDD
jgi:hypothetical protein